MKGKETIKEQVYNAIMQDILSYEFRPNEILNEKKLVEKYGFSKTPIREALLSLCDENVLRSMPRYGYEVLRLTMEDVQEMLQFRYVLESGLLAANFMRFSPAQIERLEELNELCNRPDEEDIWSHWANNTEFHLKMMTYCSNNYAVVELERCMDRMKRAYAQYYWDNPEANRLYVDTRNHEYIIRSLRDKDVAGLLVALRDDLSDFGGTRHEIKIDIGPIIGVGRE
ncbi:MAG: GntR family transcriptional regulator [Tissierellia bacterium]|nr:GntR family transcriptional regulator [Tissierellia bacterium]